MAKKSHTGDEDRRIRRTRRQLRDALLSLILEKGWDDVSVLDVCEKADVGRSTFYVHFADKEDLLLSGFDELHALLDATREAADKPFAFAEYLITHAAENKQLFRAIAGRKSGQQAQWRFRDVVTTLVDADLTTVGISKASRSTLARFISGGLIEMLLTWLDRPTGPAEELAERFRRLAMGALRASGEGKTGALR